MIKNTHDSQAGFISQAGFLLLIIFVFGAIAIIGAKVYSAKYGINAHAATTSKSPPQTIPKLDTWAFCGVSPNDPSAQKAANNIHTFAGINATFGPCLPYTSYTPAETGTRYDTPADYMKLVKINALAGMKTVVYDKRLWDNSSTVRAVAYSYWNPVLPNIAAWDMGDEFDPASNEWSILVWRWTIMINSTLPATGVMPYTNHLPWTSALDKALDGNMVRASDLLSFDAYIIPTAVTLAKAYDTKVKVLMCAVNLLQQTGIPTVIPSYVENSMITLRNSGCDKFLIFGGHIPYGTTNFGTSSLVDSAGNTTTWANAVLKGSQLPVSVSIPL